MNNLADSEMSPFIVTGGDGNDKILSMLPTWAWVLIALFLIYVIFSYSSSSGNGWQTSDWSECSTTCGAGTQSRTVVCEGTDCDINEKPPLMQECHASSCWSKTDEIGGADGTEFDFKCPDGEYVNKIYYNSGDGIDSIGVRCSGTIEDVATSNMYGGIGGLSGNFDMPEGANSFQVTGEKYIGNITPKMSAVEGFYAGFPMPQKSVNYGRFDMSRGSGLSRAGMALGAWSGPTKTLSCPPHAKISGIFGKYSDWVDSLGFNCYQF